MLTLEFSNTIEQELTALAELQHKPLEQMLKDLIVEYLEDAHDALLADAAMDELARGEDTLISFAEVKRQLNELEH